MRIIALDDEDLALENIMSIIRKCVPDACIKGFKYAEDAIDYIKDNPIDCAFLDVEMSGMNGVELARILTAGNSKVKKVNGSASHWWERSPQGGNSTNFCFVLTGGDTNYSYADYSCGVSFGFCV